MATYYVDADLGTGDNNGTSWTHAWRSIQTAIDYASLAAGDVIYCKGTETAGAAIDFDGVTGTWVAPIKFIGVNTATTAMPPTGSDMGTNRFIIDAASGNYAAAHFNGAMDYLWFINFEFNNSGNSSGILCDTSNTLYVLFVNCKFASNNQSGVYSDSKLLYSMYKQCLFTANGIGVYRPSSTSLFVACSFYDNTSYGIDNSVSFYAIGCTFTANDSAAFRDVSQSLVYGCVIDSNTASGADGIITYAAAGSFYIGIRVTNINDQEITCSLNSEVFMDYVYTDGAITKTTAPWYVPDKTMVAHVTESGGTDDGYVTGELNLATGATYRSEAIEIPSA